jgi:polyhydroxyalkanoate synthesis regulator phasin
MNIQTVVENLRRTIAGKEQMLHAVQKERTFVGLRDGEGMALQTTAHILQINIDELKRILQDVEQCVKETV